MPGARQELQDKVPVQLHLLHVAQPPVERTTTRASGAASMRWSLWSGDVRRIPPRSGEVVDEVLDSARDLGASLILMGYRGGKGAVERLFSGATARDILYRAPCPVWFEPASRARAVAPSALTS